MKFDLKAILITLAIVAGVLALITFYVVFYGSNGTYVVSSDLGPNAGIFSTSTTNIGTASSTASSSLALATSTGSSSLPIAAPVTWKQGNETISVTGAMMSGSQLTLSLQVAMGQSSECVPLTVRMIADEQGDLSPPTTGQFTFPDTGNCNGTPGETYTAQPVVFALSGPASFPVVFTSGGDANLLFEVDQNPDGTLSVGLPPNAG